MAQSNVRLLFVFSNKVHFSDKGNIYTNGSFSNSVWERYLWISDDFHVLMNRTRHALSEAECEKKYNLLDQSRVTFVAIPNMITSAKDYLDMRNRRRVLDILRKEVMECGALIVRSPGTFLGHNAVKFAKQYGKPYLVEVVGDLWKAYWNRGIKHKLMAFPYEYRVKQNIRNATHAVYVTNKYLQNKYPTRGKSVNASNVEIFDQDYDASIVAARKDRLSQQDLSEIHIGTIAKLDNTCKGQQYVIRALARLNKDGHRYKYHLLGSGNPARLTALAEKLGVLEDIVFDGVLPRHQVNQWLDTLDIYIQPSLQEGLPRSVIEAMSRGCPCIGSNICGTPELLNPDFVYEAKSVRQLCVCIAKMERDRMLLEIDRSFAEAEQYLKRNIDSRRQAFYLEFLRDHKLAD